MGGGSPVPSVGELIQKTRKSKGWSQEELGYRAKIDQSRLSKLERGENAPTRPQAQRLAEALELDLTVLWKSQE